MEMKVECDDNNMTRETISSQDLSHQMDIQMAGAESLDHTSGSGWSSGNFPFSSIIKNYEIKHFVIFDSTVAYILSTTKC